MAINLALQNPASGEIKFVKVGFSWTLFFFSTFLGIPFFVRKLHRWGFTMLAINVAAVVFPMLMTRNAAVMNQIIMFLGQIGLTIYWGVKGNEVTAKHWLAQGWRFIEPQSDAVKYAKMRWRIFDQSSSQTEQLHSANSSAAP